MDVIQTNRKMLQILGLRYNTKKLEIKTNFRNLNMLENLFLYWFIKIENLKAKLRSFAMKQ